MFTEGVSAGVKGYLHLRKPKRQKPLAILDYCKLQEKSRVRNTLFKNKGLCALWSLNLLAGDWGKGQQAE